MINNIINISPNKLTVVVEITKSSLEKYIILLLQISNWEGPLLPANKSVGLNLETL